MFPTSVSGAALVTPWDGTFWLPALSATLQVAGICVLGGISMAFYTGKKTKRKTLVCLTCVAGVSGSSLFQLML